MAAEKNRQWRLAKRPVGMVEESDFEFREEPVPAVPDGGVLVRNLLMAFDPAMRGWMENRASYMPPLQIGEVMRGGGVGEVVESRDPSLPVGKLVQGLLGWQEYAAYGAGAPLNALPEGVAPELALGVLGTTGLTAYFGILEVGQLKDGDTVVVSAAAGATGSVASQIAKLHGCRTVGIAGGPAKCSWLTSDCGLDAAIDYKSEDVEERLRELCPEGVDLYFDNVGGGILDAVLGQIALRARVVLCGAISRYNETERGPGPKNYFNLTLQRGRMEGFIVLDYAAKMADAGKQLLEWERSGKLVHKEDVQKGIENAPRTLQRLFRSENFGRQLLRLAESGKALPS